MKSCNLQECLMSHNIKVAMVVSQFNGVITEKLLASALQQLKKLGVDDKNIYVANVPGAIEIPLIAKLLAKSTQYDAIITLGAVIRGETSHYDYVCEQVSAGCMQVMLDFQIPVIFGVLTTENEEQAEARVNKGAECVDAALAMAKLCQSING